MSARKIYIITFLIIAGMLASSCGSSSGTSRGYVGGSVHYHHGVHGGWGYPYGYGTDVIVIDDYDYDYGMPDAVTLPADDW